MIVAVMMPQVYYFPKIAVASSPPASPKTVKAIQVSLKLPTEWEKQLYIKKLLVKRSKPRRKAVAVRRVSRPKPRPKIVSRRSRVPKLQFIRGFIGSMGYTIPYGNCVWEVPAHRRPMGNPITWVPRTQTPYIGAIVLFHYNHTGIITGLYSNGDIEIRHQNGGGLPHRFPRSEFRGFI